MTNRLQALDGISGILVTPFDAQDRLAPAALKPIVDCAIDAGVHVLVANRQHQRVLRPYRNGGPRDGPVRR